MLILGVRTAPKELRYALLEWDGTSATLCNTSSESRLKIPANCNSLPSKLCWLQQELERILRQNQTIVKVMVKTNEFGRGGESGASREAAYLDAVVVLFAGNHSLPVETKCYRAIGTRRDEVKSFAATNVGTTSQNWNEQIADAVAVAWSGRET